MYKFYFKSKAKPPGYAFKFLLAMKLTTLFLIAAILQVSASTMAQKITFSTKDASLKEVFDKISDQSGYDFLASSSVLKQAKPVTLTVKAEDLKTVLDKIFADQPLRYVIQEKMVVVSPKTTAKITAQLNESVDPITISGKVTDSLGNTLPGATIKVVGTATSTTTNNDGVFSINANLGDQIAVSFVGFNPYSFKVAGEMPYQNIVLHTAASKLQEVNVISTGYQTLPRERVTGSFAQPIKAEYDARIAPDVISKLNGITSGLLFNANTLNTPSGRLDLNIRGRSTIFANDQPLIIVDNFPYSGDINNINPNDVQSITVLKDAAAASIWGVRAGNGVIVITTQRGKLNQPLKLDFSANLTVFNKPDLNYNPNQLNASSYINLEKFLFDKGFFDGNLSNTTTYPVVSPVVELLAANRAGTLTNDDLNKQLDVLRQVNSNDQLGKYFYQKAANQQYAVSLSGGSGKANYYFSTGFDRDVASVKDNASQRITVNSQNNFQLLKKLEFSAGVNYVKSTSYSDNTLIQVQNKLYPYSKIADDNGNPLPISYNFRQSFVQAAPGSGFLDWSFYPLKELGATSNTTTVADTRLNSALKYTFFKGLSAEIKYQYENSLSQNKILQGQETYAARDYINTFSIVTNGQVSGHNVPLGGILNISNSSLVANNFRGQLNYDNSWADHHFTALAGYEFSQTSGDSNQSLLYGYNDDLGTFSNIDAVNSFVTFPSGNQTIYNGLGVRSSLVRVRSTFANAAYTYQDRYTISGSARIDGTNYFGVATNQKNVPLWSAGFKWDISRESFYKVDWLPVLDFRGSYGYNGNLIQSITGVTTLQYYSNAAYTNYNYALISNIGNPDLRWEKTGIANLAIDFGTKYGNITGSFEYYFKKETDLLGFKNFPENSGITQLEGNYADMKSRGFDLSVTSRNINSGLKWYTTILFSHATDKVTHYDVLPYSYQLAGAGTGAPNFGRPVFGVYAYKWGGLDPSNGNPIGYVNGAKSQDYSAITVNSAVSDLIYEGSARPTYFGGINNRLTYKNFGLSIQINYKLGYYFMSPALTYSGISANSVFLRVNRDYSNRWQVPGDEQKTNVPSLIYPFNSARDQFYKYSEVNVEKADHVRLQDVTLSYDLNKTTYHQLPFATLQLFIHSNNIGILWRANHKGLDPDAIPTTDNTTMPVPRSVAIGVKGTF